MTALKRPAYPDIVEWVEDQDGNNCGRCLNKDFGPGSTRERKPILYGLDAQGRTRLWWCPSCGWAYEPTRLHKHKRQEPKRKPSIPDGCVDPFCRCGGRKGLALHHIRFRGEGGGDSPHNLIPLCVEAHERAHNGTGRGKAWISGRQYMITVLEALKPQPWFRWAGALRYLQTREKLKRVGGPMMHP